MHCNNATNPGVEIKEKSARISFKSLIYFTLKKCSCKAEQKIILRAFENKLYNSRVYISFNRNTGLLHLTYKMKGGGGEGGSEGRRREAVLNNIQDYLKLLNIIQC